MKLIVTDYAFIWRMHDDAIQLRINNGIRLLVGEEEWISAEMRGLYDAINSKPSSLSKEDIIVTLAFLIYAMVRKGVWFQQ